MPLEALIAEDEELLRQSLLEQLGRLWPELKVVAECEDGASALEQLAEKQPDIAFLDIRMPGISGIEVARSLSELSPRTQVVFVTAYDQYAIDAFEQGAMDYLLKPVSDERLLATRERILSRLPSTRQDDAVLERLLQRLGPLAAVELVQVTPAAGLDYRQQWPRDTADHAGRRGLLPRRQQVHHGGHRRRREPAAHAAA